MKIALAQINTANGDIEGNARKIRRYLEKARATKPDLIIFPELCLVGYPPKDFLFQHGFVEQAETALEKLAKDFSDLNFLLGSVAKSMDRRFWNVAHFVSQGAVQTTAKKNLLPNYDVFDERRYFCASEEVTTIQLNGKKIGITICEDMWASEIPFYSHDPMKKFQRGEVDLMINISASPFDHRKYQHRLDIIRHHAQHLSAPFAYVNLIGGNDELLFDGGSFIVNPQGVVMDMLPFFEEELRIVDLSDPKPKLVTTFNETEVLSKALIRGLRDFVGKSGNQDVTFGLSGGIDSALVLLLAIEAFGKECVYPVFMPSKYTSDMSKEDVKTMASRSGISVTMFSIDSIVDSFTNEMQKNLKNLQTLTQENIQARARGILLMSYSAEKKALVLNTTNKSELSVGYGTMYGDLIGALSPIGDLYKYQVYKLATHLNRKHQIIPERVFTRAPSAELKDNQKDADTLPEYDILDALVEKYIEEERGVEELIQQGFTKKDVDFVISMIAKNEFKRRQSPPVLRVSSKSFGVGRRMPIARKQYEF